MPATSKSGGKRAGAGRKSGAEWAHKRSETVRAVARVRRVEVLNSDRDPLSELLRIGFESEDEELRVKALGLCLPHLYPRLSMAVIADATPKQAEKITREMLAIEIAERIGKLPTIDHDPAPIDSATDYQSADKD